MVTMATLFWAQVITAVPACVLTGRAAVGSSPEAATAAWMPRWCVCAAPATEVSRRFSPDQENRNKKNHNENLMKEK